MVVSGTNSTNAATVTLEKMTGGNLEVGSGNVITVKGYGVLNLSQVNLAVSLALIVRNSLAYNLLSVIASR
jgi:hypothetical protein